MLRTLLIYLCGNGILPYTFGCGGVQLSIGIESNEVIGYLGHSKIIT